MVAAKKAVVLKAPGTNNDLETKHALDIAGAETSVYHINCLSKNPGILDKAGILVIPGGFSYGDNLGAGRILSVFLKYHLRDCLEKFIKKGKMLAGICNGFQALVKGGFLPGSDNNMELTLSLNRSGLFKCIWRELEVKRSNCYFKGLGERVQLPVANAQGRFKATEYTMKKLKKEKLIALEYVSSSSSKEERVAALTNGQGNVLGMMPHPERFLYPRQHPASDNSSQKPWGRKIYENMVKYA